MNMTGKIFCLAGMHRSGTSLMSSYFDACGINMGERLVGAMRGNERGHFEDTDIVCLHSDILAFNHCHMYTPSRKLVVPEHLAARARTLLAEKRAQSALCGWKDPRTTLFLDFWAALDPAICFVLLYREPLAVTGSLRRRGTDRRIALMPWIPAHAWLRYNQEVLSFHERYPGRSVIISIKGFNRTHEASRQKLGNALGVSFSRPYTDVFHKGEIKDVPLDKGSSSVSFFDRIYMGRLSAVYNALEKVALISSSGSQN